METKLYLRKQITLFKRIIISLLVISGYSCESFVEVNSPSGQLSTEAVFEDKSTANAAVSNIYASLRDSGMLTGNSVSITTKMGAYTDELNFYGISSGTTLNFYSNTLLPTNPQVVSWWKTAYSQIYAANSVIQGVTASAALTSADKNQFIGEALFIRSLLHFYLLNLYGDVPYVTATDYKQNTAIGRTSTNLLYSKIIEDLQTSYAFLPESYLSADRSRANKAVAMALLARVYLYSKAWAEAANAASYLLNNTETYKWENDLSKIFLKGSSVTIWQYKPAIEGQNSAEGGSMILLTGPPADVALNPNFVNAFEIGDQRRQKWIGSVTKGTLIWYFSSKYKVKLKTAASTEYNILFRLAEQYLIRAEARAQQGDLIGAKEDLNKIRQNAGLGNTTAVSQQEILEAVMRERRFELFTESAHRFFDLKRNGQLDSQLTGVKNGWNSTDNLLPVPESELTLNPNLLPQNPGY
ncbi:RagB/SusD family nutrient uptake outer membrane protein [Flavobacterium ajazii]|uniref:RagB/SusD family nutrient uptake outer membrane protein n=1 Tax=Flavobacterium ajazii TaxID=2692318 RepID=UPI0013D4C6BA|nr:RagB/SusD family nutrient uptake outer membrane protein [Flavobacterium ajazii]